MTQTLDVFNNLLSGFVLQERLFGMSLNDPSTIVGLCVLLLWYSKSCVSAVAGECHCNTSNACSVFPSSPCSLPGGEDRCQEGWFGQYCQKQNVALRKPASQSSVWYEQEETAQPLNLTASYAVDGKASTLFIDSPCSHTDRGDFRPYWKVFLGARTNRTLLHMRLYLREIWKGRNNGMKILVDNQMCYSWPATKEPPPEANVTCRQPLAGNTVTIRTPREYLTLCEVEIFVCSDGWFGEDCDKQCHCLDVCDKITGRCQSGCDSGFLGTTCQTPCDDGRYGNQCQLECGQCTSSLPCNKASGMCEDGCNPGFQEPFCVDQCVAGLYGSNCTSRCGHCKDSQICNKIDGVCPGGCANNYKAPLCQVPVQSCDDARQLASHLTAAASALGVVILIIVLVGSLYIIRLKMDKKALEMERDNISCAPLWIKEE
ncbi:multiple epidermal growth factor-like domains protein 11 isoform X2 [Haliotis rufescens]|uniref:multiple epidermal growth factor-like domains protein 11 isoform X2 n=1 Tax=Haliotis rufescens TaxID=6454 RepID=UPI00201F5321|nr:multiple epidermal growth factor-like domains protein 11 isoform X2 [Haliotis rufescens]